MADNALTTFVNSSVDAKVRSMANILINADSDTSGEYIRKMVLNLKNAFISRKMNHDEHVIAWAKYPAIYFETLGYDPSILGTTTQYNNNWTDRTHTVEGVDYLKEDGIWEFITAYWAYGNKENSMESVQEWPVVRTEGRGHWRIVNMHPTDARIRRASEPGYNSANSYNYPPHGIVLMTFRNNTNETRSVSFNAASHTYTSGASQFMGHVWTPSQPNSRIQNMKHNEYTVKQLFNVNNNNADQGGTCSFDIPPDTTVIYSGAHPYAVYNSSYITGRELLVKYLGIGDAYDKHGYVTPDKNVLQNIISKQCFVAADFWKLTKDAADQLIF